MTSTEGLLNVEMRPPTVMGGPAGNFLNPEILFASGYAACFDSALNGTIQREKVKTGTTSVTAEVSIGKLATGGYGLAVKLVIEIPDIDKDKAEGLANKAHQVCPYSNATRGNIDVQLVVNETASLAIA